MTSTPRLFDSHAHLDFPKFQDDLPAVIDRARKAGVERIVTIGASRGLGSNHRALEIAREFDDIRCTTGFHPHEAQDCTDEFFEIIASEFAELPEVVAIGETGLDYHYDKSPRPVQKEVFRRFLELAMDVDKPVVIHTRDAEEDTINILKEVGIRRGILHCFSGSADLAQAGLELGFHISFSGIATFKNAKDILQVAVDTPSDRIMVETDAPFLAPSPNRGKTNEPAFVRFTAQKIAEARGTTLEDFAALTFENASRLYDWDFGA